MTQPLASRGADLQDGLVAEWELGEAERRVWEASSRGAWVDFRTGDEVEDDLAKAEGWGPERVVRAEVIAALLLGAGETEPGHRPAVRLRGARITGRLDLMGAAVDRPLVCEYCRFDEPLRCVEATTKTVRIVSCRLPSFNGARMRTEGILNFYDSEIDGGVRLDRAKIVGEVSFRGGRLGPNPDGVALAADGMTVDGPIECNAGFSARGTVLLRGARIDGGLDVSDAKIVRAGGPALLADRAVINGAFMADRLVAEGRVQLIHANVAGEMNLLGASLRDPGGWALSCGGMVIHGGIWCVKGFTAEGQVRFIGAELHAALTLKEATLSNPDGAALNLDRANVGEINGVDLTVSAGMISLIGTKITDRLSLDRARLGGEDDDTALWMEGGSIGGSLWLTWLRTFGDLRIRHSTIGGQVMLTGAWLETADDVALRFTRNEVGTDVVCDGMVVIGETRFVASRIGRHLALDQVCLINPGGVALEARTLEAGEVSLLPSQPVQGTVVLDHARIGLLRDDPAAWPDQLRLDGLTYESLQPALPARRRLQWLAHGQDGFQPQPYEQLAALYTRTGQPTEARRVLHAKERRQRTTKPFLGRVWSVLQDATVAYGYKPWRPVLWLTLLLIIGGVTYGITPPDALKRGEAPHFNSVIYTLDLLLPIVDLGQERAYNPADGYQWFSYFLIAAGWILATTIAAGVARILTRR